MDGASLADGNLWLHFTRTADWRGPNPSVPVIDRGEGCYVWDTAGKRYLDGLSALFCVQVGYGRPEMPAAAAEQMAKLPFATNWATAHQPAIDLAAALADRFPPTWTTSSSSTPGPRRSRRRSSWPASTTRPTASPAATRSSRGRTATTGPRWGRSG